MPLSTDSRAGGLSALLGSIVLLGACASGPAVQEGAAPPGQATTAAPAASQAGTAQGQAAAAASSKSGVSAAPGAQAGAPIASAPLPPRATADFGRAVGLMRGGNATEAELEFKQMTLAYPQLCAPYVNLGILYRKTGHLDQSEEALKNAVARNNASATAWNELGVTQRQRGEFTQAADSYEHAIAADANFAAAYRNLGVVADLYLGDPERALTALERYKELTGEDRPVTSWIAELRQRTGKGPAKPPTDAGKGAAPGPAAPQPSGDTAPAMPAAAPSTSPPPKAGD